MKIEITAQEVQDAWDLLHTALDYIPADTKPEVVNRVLGLVLATRNRNDVAAMHNMIVVKLAETFSRIDTLIEATQAVLAETQRQVDISEVSVDARLQALATELAVLKKGLAKIDPEQSNTK